MAACITVNRVFPRHPLSLAVSQYAAPKAPSVRASEIQPVPLPGLKGDEGDGRYQDCQGDRGG